MSVLLHQKIGRNDPCPCGSGKKYKRCCVDASPVSTDSAWKRQREAWARLNDAMLTFARRRFPDEFYDAWEDFNQTILDGADAKALDEAQIFFPYFLFEWDPERPVHRRGNKPRVGLVARSFLQEAGNRMSELEELIFEQATTQPLSFYEVVLAEPGKGLKLRDILIGGDTDVAERSASLTLRPGDVCYGQIWRFPDVSTLGRLAPVVIPPSRKAEVIGLRAKLRKKIAKQSRELEPRDLVRYTEEIRSVYLDIREGMRLPPVLCNTDGDLIVFHTLTFQVGSAQTAFDALAPLAWGFAKEELLETAEVGPDGTLHSVTFDWCKKGNKKIKTWDNTIMGHLHISGRSLVAEVNSVERAELFCHEVEKRLGILATHKKTVEKTVDEGLEDLRREKELQTTSGKKSRIEFLDPGVRRHAEEQIQQQVEGWIHERIPALGGRTPIQAIEDPDGREIVEALLLGWERSLNGPAAPEIIRPNLSAVRKLLKLSPFVD